MGKKILIVEDDEILREIYALKLSMEGFSVDTVGDGLEALAYVERIPPDLIILDMMMPRMGGLQFLRRYTRGSGVPAAKVLVASNKTLKPEIDEAKKLGASEYLVKSQITPDDLVGRVHKYLSDDPVPDK